jgi:BirA family biotin operon repressor/biotin-[acetyl-CoA-carboxylase] ligase
MAELDTERIFIPRHGPRHVGADGEVHEVVPSTMDVARQRCEQGAEDGYVVLAERQSAGRGRTGAWMAPAGQGVLMSVVLRLGVPSNRQRLIVLMAAVATVEALRKLGVDGSIKWPNDIVIAREQGGKLKIQKLGGLIVERVLLADGPAAHVLGLGLNVNQDPDDLPDGARIPASSMKLHKGRPFDRSRVIHDILEQLDAWYRILAHGQEERILARWRSHSCLLGHEVLARVGRVGVQAAVEGLRATGEIILRAPDGRQMVLSDSEVTLLSP